MLLKPFIHSVLSRFLSPCFHRLDTSKASTRHTTDFNWHNPAWVEPTFQWVTLPIPPLFSHILHFTPCGATEACGNLYCAHFEWGGGGYDMQANPHSQVPTPNEQLQGWAERTNKLTNQSVHRRGGLTTPRGQDMPPAHWYLNSLQYMGQVYTALVYAP